MLTCTVLNYKIFLYFKKTYRYKTTCALLELFVRATTFIPPLTKRLDLTVYMYCLDELHPKDPLERMLNIKRSFLQKKSLLENLANPSHQSPEPSFDESGKEHYYPNTNFHNLGLFLTCNSLYQEGLSRRPSRLRGRDCQLTFTVCFSVPGLVLRVVQIPSSSTPRGRAASMATS